MTGLFDFLSYSIGLGGTRWRLYPALVISLLISDSILVVESEIGKQIYLVIPLLIALVFAIFQKGKIENLNN